LKNLTNVTFRNNINHVIFNKLFPNHADKLHHHSRQDETIMVKKRGCLKSLAVITALSRDLVTCTVNEIPARPPFWRGQARNDISIFIDF